METHLLKDRTQSRGRLRLGLVEAAVAPGDCHGVVIQQYTSLHLLQYGSLIQAVASRVLLPPTPAPLTILPLISKASAPTRGQVEWARGQ